MVMMFSSPAPQLLSLGMVLSCVVLASGFAPHSLGPSVFCHKSSLSSLGRSGMRAGASLSTLAPRSIDSSALRPACLQRIRSKRNPLTLRMATSGMPDPNLMDGEQYTEKAFEILQRMPAVADKFNQQYLEVEVLLYSAIQDETVQRIISKAAGKGAFSSFMQQFLRSVEDTIRGLPSVSGGSSQKIMGGSLRESLEEALRERKQLNDDYTSVEHILMAAIKHPRISKSGLLEKHSLSEAALKEAVESIRSGQRVTSRNPEATFEALNKYGRDLTEEAKAGKLDPVIGRDEEIRRTIQILSRRTKNNPVLLGEPGVGKTAVVEGLAQRIASGDVPASLKGRKVFALDLGSLVAGAKFRGEFEERLKAVINEVKASDSGIVLFLDEIHTVVGAGKTDGAMDAGNLLKPMLARGELRCIGATTLDEYRKYIEKDPALERRFQQVMVSAPSVEDTISILRGLKDRYEVHHGVRIQDEAIVAAATLSDRYISDRFLPDKAIDLIDESAAKLKMEMTSKPVELDRLDRKIMQLQMEKLSLKSDTNRAARERQGVIDKEIDKLSGEQRKIQDQWESEQGSVTSVQEIKEEIDRMKIEIDQAETSYNLQKAAELKYAKLPELEKQLEDSLDSMATKSTTLMRDEVTDTDIASVVSVWTGIPVSKLATSEAAKLLQLEDVLSQRVVGQPNAVKAIAEAVQRTRAGLANAERPTASFMFLGPTGVGKTQLAKSLCEQLFDDESKMVRIDMSEYMEKSSVSRLLGAPPGYVGYEEGGQLSEAVRRRPYSVVLFDEIEKAHPEVFNVLLQVLDDGRVTDGQGRTVNFKNTIIIFTSNIGSDVILELGGTPETDQEMRQRVMEEMKRRFRPEFLNRLDEQIIFNSLGKDDIRLIVKQQVKVLNKRLKDKNISIRCSDAAESFIADIGYDPVYGVRPLQRAVRRELETPLAKGILQGDFGDGDSLVVDIENDRLSLSLDTGDSRPPQLPS